MIPARQFFLEMNVRSWIVVAATAFTGNVTTMAIAIVAEEPQVVSGKLTKTPQGQFQFHHVSKASSDNNKCCDSVVLINVGTGMSVRDYENLAAEIVRYDGSTVTVIMDNNPGRLRKQDGTKFTNLVNAIAQNLTTAVPSCCHSAPKNGYLIGGHSAGGEAAVHALASANLLDFQVAGFLGLAPYEIDPSETNIAVPALIWDFSQQSCFVAPSRAGIAAYDQASQDRIFYQVQTYNMGTGGLHCAFADRACAFILCGGNSATRAWLHAAIAESIHRFFQYVVVAATPLKKDNMVLNIEPELEIHLFVNQDSIGDSNLQRSGRFSFATVIPHLPNLFLEQWSAHFQREWWKTGLFSKTEVNGGSCYHDRAHGQSMEEHVAGQNDHWCECASSSNTTCRILSFSASHTKAFQDKPTTYVYMPDIDYCCLLFHGAGPIERDWISSNEKYVSKSYDNVRYSGHEQLEGNAPEQSCLVWDHESSIGETSGNFTNSDRWLIGLDASSKSIPYGYRDALHWKGDFTRAGIQHGFDFDVSTYSTDPIDPAVFELPKQDGETENTLNSASTSGSNNDGGGKCQQPCANRKKPWCQKAAWAGVE